MAHLHKIGVCDECGQDIYQPRPASKVGRTPTWYTCRCKSGHRIQVVAGMEMLTVTEVNPLTETDLLPFWKEG